MYMEEALSHRGILYQTSRHYERVDVSVVFSRERDPYEIFEGAFLAGLKKIKENGTYLAIFRKYYGENPPAATSDDIAAQHSTRGTSPRSRLMEALSKRMV